MRWPLTCRLIAAGALVSFRIAAQPPVRLHVSRGPGTERCPEDDVFRHSVGGNTRTEPFAPGAPARLEVTIARVGARYQGTAALRDETGVLQWTVELDPIEDCFTALEGLGLAAGVKLDPIGPEAEPAPV